MSIETLVVVCIVFAILYAIVRYIVPEPIKQIAYYILLGAAVIWIVTHLRALLHCCTGV